MPDTAALHDHMFAVKFELYLHVVVARQLSRLIAGMYAAVITNEKTSKEKCDAMVSSSQFPSAISLSAQSAACSMHSPVARCAFSADVNAQGDMYSEGLSMLLFWFGISRPCHLTCLCWHKTALNRHVWRQLTAFVHTCKVWYPLEA